MEGLFWWVRDTDETGMSGLGRVAQVAVFEDGTAIMRWLKNHNAAGVGSTVIYDTVEQLVHVHGHGEKKTGHLEPVFALGDIVQWNCTDGFSGVARIVGLRESDFSHYKVQICDQRDVEHSYQPATWAYDFEVSRRL